MADLCHTEVGGVGIPVGSKTVLQGNLLALQGIHQVPELRGWSHAPSTAGAAHHCMAIVAAKLQVVWRWERKKNGAEKKLIILESADTQIQVNIKTNSEIYNIYGETNME